jgi:hypothetical protein
MKVTIDFYWNDSERFCTLDDPINGLSIATVATFDKKSWQIMLDRTSGWIKSGKKERGKTRKFPNVYNAKAEAERLIANIYSVE